MTLTGAVMLRVKPPKHKQGNNRYELHRYFVGNTLKEH
jgi:hypothetical protein